MGWTWALWLCNEAVLSIARSFSPWNDGILRERKPTQQLDNCRTIVGVYVDNITVIGSSAEDVRLVVMLFRGLLTGLGFPSLGAKMLPFVNLKVSVLCWILRVAGSSTSLVGFGIFTWLQSHC